MFGRRKQDDDDPFAALKSGNTYTSEPSTTVPGIPGTANVAAPQSQAGPVTSSSARAAGARTQATRARPRTAAPHPARPVRFARRLSLVRLLIPLVAVLIVVAAASHLSSNGGGSGTPPILGSAPSPGVGAFGAGGSGTATGSGSGKSSAAAGPTSYLTTANLSTGLARVIEMAPGSKLLLLRIDSSSLDATVLTANHQAKNIDFGPYGTTVTGAGSPGSRAMSFSSIKPAVVPALIRQMQSQFHVPAKHINYLVAYWFPGLPPWWGVYLNNDTDYQASLSGAGLHRNG
jgi:hypothetical protein